MTLYTLFKTYVPCLKIVRVPQSEVKARAKQLLIRYLTALFEVGDFAHVRHDGVVYSLTVYNGTLTLTYGFSTFNPSDLPVHILERVPKLLIKNQQRAMARRPQ